MSWTLADSVHVTVVWNHKQAVFRFVTLLWHTISKNLAQKLSRARKSQSNHQYEYCLETQELVCGLQSNWVFLIIFPPLYYTLWNYVSACIQLSLTEWGFCMANFWTVNTTSCRRLLQFCLHPLLQAKLCYSVWYSLLFEALLSWNKKVLSHSSLVSPPQASLV